MSNVVTFHYTLRDPEGRVLDTSAGGAPISFIQGSGQIIEGLDEALRGVPEGTKTNVVVPAAKAYGTYDEAQVQRVPRNALPIEGELQVGDRFQAGEDAYAPIVVVRAIEGEEVLLDANHPLAGVDLAFDVEVIGVRAATKEELDRGHGDCGNTDCGCKH